MSVSPETYDNILKYGLQASYDAIQDKDSDVLYFCTDTKKIYKGTIDFTDSVVYAATRPTTGIIVGKVYLIGDLTTRSYTTEVYDGSAWHILGNATITSITSETATDSVLPTALAVKTYVDNQIGGSGVVASVAASTTSEGYLTVTDGAGAATEVGVPGVVTTPTYEASTRTFTFPVVGDDDVVVELGKDIFIDSSANNRYENGNIYLYLNDGEGTTDPTELVIPVTGLITDYIAAVLHAMRNDDRTSVLKEYAKFDGTLSERDHLAIRKTFSGMMKLLYPDGKMTDEEAYELIDFAAECRKRVKDQLYVVDETFKAEPAVFKYINLKTGMEVKVETLERISNAHLFPVSVVENPEEGELNDGDTQAMNQGMPQTESNDGKRPRIPILQEKNLSFRMGQTGVNYKKLFATYLAEAKEITVEDPYIRAPWQIKNFMEFVTMLIETRPVDDLKLHLFTNEEEEKIPDLIDKLDDIKDDLAGYGIEFDYKLRDFHDRCIKTDTGWTITLGRGLDMFEKYSPYSIEALRQDKRKCKEFMVTFMKTKNV